MFEASHDEPLSPEEQDALVTRAREVATQISVLQAEYASLAAEIAASATPAGATARQWLCLSTGVLPSEASRALRIGAKLASLPNVAGAFAQGALSEATVDAIARVGTPQNEDALLEAAEVATGAQLLTLIRSYKRVRPEPDPEPDQEPTEEPERLPDDFWGHFDENGRFRFWGDVNGEFGATIMATIDGEIAADRQRRREASDEGLRQEERGVLSRAEALANVFAGYQAAVAAGRADGVVPSSHQAIVHIDKAAVENGWTDRAAFLQDGDAIDATTARRMACDAAWRAVITEDLDPEGVTREKRLAGPGQRAAAYVRDRTCCFPGCNRTRWLKLHHLDPAVAGGATRLDNLICLCQTHHTLIHKPGWQIVGSPRAGLCFVRPDGSEVGRSTRPEATDLPPPPPVEPHQRYQATGEKLTSWGKDLLLAHWLSIAA